MQNYRTNNLKVVFIIYLTLIQTCFQSKSQTTNNPMQFSSLVFNKPYQSQIQSTEKTEDQNFDKSLKKPEMLVFDESEEQEDHSSLKKSLVNDPDIILEKPNLSFQQDISEEVENALNSKIGNQKPETKIPTKIVKQSVEEVLENNKDKNNKKTLKKDSNIQSKKSQSILSIIINITFIILGLYVGLFGFRAFKFLIILLGIFISYYIIILILKYSTDIDFSSNLVQVCILMGSLIFGILYSYICYLLQRQNFILFGISVGAMISWFYCSFFVDFEVKQDLFYMLGIFLVASLMCIIAGFFWIDYTIVIGSSLVGSLVVPINIGIMIGDFPSFENREKLRPDRFEDYQRYLIIAIVIFMIGMSIQFYKRHQIAKEAALLSNRDSIHNDLELNDV